MAKSDIIVRQQTRLAYVTLSELQAKTLAREPGKCICDVLGIYQAMDVDWAGPVAVCVLDDGRLIEVSISYIQFINYDDGFLHHIADRKDLV